jgi:serine/threonine-protein kinase
VSPPRSDDDRRALADTLLDRLIDVPAEDRAAALDEWCRDDPVLHALVSELCRLIERRAPGLDAGAIGGDLRQQAVERLQSEPRRDEPSAGQRIGRWRVIQELGHGGMGTVYLVSRADGEFEQRAALKLSRQDRLSPGVVRHLERERQILASLGHSAIARLLDGGQTEDGRPYFVMEHVAGRTVDRYADDERLTVDQRLALFTRVAAAIEHAHQRLVIHRDIKPSNIVVTDDGEVKVLDFGIARLLSRAGDDIHDPRPAPHVLTPEYASPEDVRGEPATTASDVYQLGLLLYELLTGLPAQRVGPLTPEALEEAICLRPAIPPSLRVSRFVTGEIAAARRTSPRALARRLSGDLDAIVLMALHKQPERRYQAVGELIADVEHHRRGFPVTAAGHAVMYRVRTFARRHRVALAWAAAGMFAAAWLVVQFGEQRVRVARQAARAEQIERILTRLFTPPVAGTAPRPPNARDYLDHALTLVRREIGSETPARARLLDRLANAYIPLGHYAVAADVLEESLAAHRQLSRVDSSESAQTLALLGQTQHYLGRYRDAELSLKEALRIQRLRFGGDDNAAALVSLELADLMHTRGELADAERLLREVLAVGERGPAGDYPLATATRHLANVLQDRGSLDEAENRYRASLRLYAGRDPFPRTDVAITELYFARLMSRTRELGEAERLLGRSLAALRATFQEGHPLTGMALRNLGYLRMEQGRLAEAERALDESEAMLGRWLGARHPLIARTHADQAELAARAGHWEIALALSIRTLEEFASLDLVSHPSALDACLTFGEARIQLGHDPAAVERLAACTDHASRLFVPGDPRTARLREVLERARGASRDDGDNSRRVARVP